MALTAGIVGLPNVGKSTLFNAITKAGALAANYPFATIEPNVGMVEVPDERLKVLLETIMESNKLAGMISNPKMGKEIIERERLEKDRALIKDDDFAAWWEDYSQFLPDDLEVIAIGDDVDLEGGGIDLERMNEFYADEIERNISESKGGENND